MFAISRDYLRLVHENEKCCIFHSLLCFVPSFTPAPLFYTVSLPCVLPYLSSPLPSPSHLIFYFDSSLTFLLNTHFSSLHPLLLCFSFTFLSSLLPFLNFLHHSSSRSLSWADIIKNKTREGG